MTSMRVTRWTRWPAVRILCATLSGCLAGAQLGPVPEAEASHLSSTMASAGSAPPQAAGLIESFQPDLFTGRASMAIPIVVPPGRRGVQPSLALAYSSSTRNGWVGVGW